MALVYVYARKSTDNFVIFGNAVWSILTVCLLYLVNAVLSRAQTARDVARDRNACDYFPDLTCQVVEFAL